MFHHHTRRRNEAVHRPLRIREESPSRFLFRDECIPMLLLYADKSRVGKNGHLVRNVDHSECLVREFLVVYPAVLGWREDEDTLLLSRVVLALGFVSL